MRHSIVTFKPLPISNRTSISHQHFALVGPKIGHNIARSCTGTWRTMFRSTIQTITNGTPSVNGTTKRGRDDDSFLTTNALDRLENVNSASFDDDADGTRYSL